MNPTTRTLEYQHGKGHCHDPPNAKPKPLCGNGCRSIRKQISTPSLGLKSKLNTDIKTSPTDSYTAIHTHPISVATSSPRTDNPLNTRRQVGENPEIETSPVPHPTSDTNNPPLTKLKVRTETSAMVLASIVLLFVITHGFRIALKVSEIASPNIHKIENFKICFALKRYFTFLINSYLERFYKYLT